MPPPAILWALAANALLYVAVPRMPLYQVSALRILGVGLSVPSLLSGVYLSVTMQAGLSVENANFVGANVHGVAMDMYYEDWNGELRHIGGLRDRASLERRVACEREEEVAKKKEGGGEGGGEGGCAGAATPSPSPILSVGARGSTESDADMVSMQMRDVSPGTYLQMTWDAYRGGGNIEILTSGMLHVKDPGLGVPMSMALVCSNSFNVMSLPWLVTGHDCAVKDVMPGWYDMETHGRRLRDKTLRKHRETGTVLRLREDDGDGPVMALEGIELEWPL